MPSSRTADRDDRPALFHGVLRAIAAVLDQGDPCSSQGQGHHARVALIGWEIASALGLEEAPVVYYAGLLHDIGAAGAEEHVTDLALREFADPTARSHPALAKYWLGRCALLEPLLPLVESHHERVDGQGFPLERAGDDIPAGASVILLADSIDFKLRQVVPERAAEAWRDVAAKLSGTGVPARVSQAALDALDGRPELVGVMLDESRLAAAHCALLPSYPGLARHSWTDTVNVLLALLARAVDTRHDRRLGHSARVADFGFEIARRIGRELVEPLDVAWAGLLHDVGTARMPRRLLGSPEEALPPAERALVERHPRDSGRIVASLPGLSHLAPAAAAHHERWDGSGYPLRLAGERIPLVGRILAYADRYASLTSSLWGGAPLSHTDAIAKLGEEIGSALDPHLAGPAMAALERSGPELLSSAHSSGLLKAVQPEPADGRRIPAVRPVRRGALLLDVEPWRRVELTRDLDIVEGLDELAAVTDRSDGRLIEHLASESGQQVLDACAGVRAGAIFSKYLFTPTGRPLEVVLQRSTSGLSLLFRSAENRLASIDRLAHFYRNFLGSSEAVVFTDPGGNIIDVNRSFLDLFGYQLREVIGQHTRVLKSGHQTGAFYEQMWATIADPAIGTWAGELVDRRRDGREIHVHMRINAVRDPSGTCLGYIAHHTDISARKHAEAEILRRDEELHRKNVELERLSQFKTDMVAITSHDLKSPLASIMGLATVVRRNLPRLSQEGVAGYLDRIAEAARNLTGFIDDLLDVEKIESGTLKLEHGRVHLLPLLEKCAERVRAAEQDRIQVAVRADRAPEPIVADVARLEQILDNLLANATKFAPDGSTIEILCQDSGDDRVLLAVEDEGPGIPPGQLTVIFDRYVQAEQKRAARRALGSGLGLSIVRSLVELHGGTVWAENRPRRGCRIVLLLPTRRGDPLLDRPVALIRAEASPEASDLAAALAELGVAARRVDSSGEFRWFCEIESPRFVFLSRRFLDPALMAYLDELRARRPLVRVALDDRVPEPGEPSLLDATLAPPVLHEELRDVLLIAAPEPEGSS